MHQVKGKGVVEIHRSDGGILSSAAHLTDLPAPKFWSCSHTYTCTSSPHAQFGFIIHPPPPVSPSLLTSAQVGSCAPQERPDWGGWSAAEPADWIPPHLSPQSLQGLGEKNKQTKKSMQRTAELATSGRQNCKQGWEASDQQVAPSSPEPLATSKGLQKPLQVTAR